MFVRRNVRCAHQVRPPPLNTRLIESLRSGSLLGWNEVGLTASTDHVSKHDRVKGPDPNAARHRVLKGRHQ